ncbi:hypothetical protein EON82_09235 [bacterium]|nr:MAG: hypothetical protein EON82_09235 [bacterium]
MLVGLLVQPAKPLPAPHQTQQASKDGRFILVPTTNAAVTNPGAVLKGFKRIAAEMKRFGGWQPAFPVRIHVVEPAQWPNAGWAAYSNEDGLFLRSEVLMRDQGNWSHEMTHLMFQGRIARWMDESLVHALTLLVWMPRVFKDKSGFNEMKAAGKEFREHPERQFDSLRPVLFAIADRFGPDIYGRFLKRVERELHPQTEHPITSAQTADVLSRAAGEDVRPYLRRWKGFAAYDM